MEIKKMLYNPRTELKIMYPFLYSFAFLCKDITIRPITAAR